MTLYEKWITFYTILAKELTRVLRLWSQTLLPPMITTTLYFLIFGQVIGSRIGVMDSYPYIQFIAPGLIMMSMITSAYTASVSSFYLAKFQRQIEEILVSPTPNFIILLGFMGGGVARSFVVGLIVTIITLFFTHLHIHSLLVILAVGFLSSCIFSLGGLINAIFAKSFDDISYIPTFILTPLTYLGGIFYSITLLPPTWQYISLANPIVYIINTFRYGFLGTSDPYLFSAFAMMLVFTIVLFSIALMLLNKSVGLRY